MSYRERIAFAMFRSGLPKHEANTQLEELRKIEEPVSENMGDEIDLSVDWALNKWSYLKLADAALLELGVLIEEARRS
ncbi:hypothetical protein IWQ54_000201 [Labrenzia sp. EL_195]|uniref:hypothetical protein n=1 Tax=Labrenzia sp. DG1229 TaxID=681847 RepID=UPI00048C1BCE|nr:hypothetical protein [Labrenzia sp. DG1229]MBG6160551.1 hypothetical protein [Labrenzia sp. EL_195]